MKRKAIIILLVVAVSVSLILSGCGSKKEKGETASVMQVSMVTGTGSTGIYDRYAGEVVSQNTVEYKKDETKTIKTVYVAEGDSVSKGDRLFSYDVDSIQISLDKASLDLEQLRNNITTYNNQISQLQSDKNNAPSSEQLDYSVQIQSIQADIAEAEYNAKMKETEVAKLTEAVANPDVVSTVDGVVKSLKQDGIDAAGNTDSTQTPSGDSTAFLTVLETGNFRIKGYINELAAQSLAEGTKVVVMSRVDDTKWTGEIQKIDWDNPVSTASSDGAYGGSTSDTSSVTSSSKYPFFVAMESTEGMRLGQHVYIEPDMGQNEAKDGLYLPSYYINDVDGEPWVWAATGKDKLEKRSLKLGQYDDKLDSYEITEGLTEEDYIAFPDDTLTEGMAVSRYDASSDSETGGTSEEVTQEGASGGGEDVSGGAEGAAVVPEG